MNIPKVTDVAYIQFLIAAQRVYTCTEAAQCAPETPRPPAHDAFVRLLHRQPPDTAALWQEVQAFVHRQAGLLILDDTTLDKPYARKMELVTRHWSGKHLYWLLRSSTAVWSVLDRTRASPGQRQPCQGSRPESACGGTTPAYGCGLYAMASSSIAAPRANSARPTVIRAGGLLPMTSR